MEPIVKELNTILDNSTIYALLSDLGKRLFFPKGIVSQAAEAGTKAKKYNATVGMATSENIPMFLPSIMKHISGLEPSEIFSYAPTAGILKLREIWKAEMLKKNPSIGNSLISLPIVTSGLTHGISITADLFIDKGDSVVVPDMYWGNYKLIIEGRRQGNVVNYPFFDKDKINIKALESKIRTTGNKKAVVVLNFPNNPTGYSPSVKESEEIISIFKKTADDGQKILVICDDAYYGLFFEDETFKESLFGKLCNLHENILAVKIDGATKEDLVWGFRTGFITFGGKGINKEQYDALQQKTMGAVRSSVSSCCTITQNLLLKGLSSGTYFQEKVFAGQKMKDRYLKVKEVVQNIPADVPLKVLPFNSGYFMTFEVLGKDSEKLRRHLLDEYSTGTISIAGKYLRIAFSSVNIEKIPDLFKLIYNAAKES
jgi:aspartate/methionine/tyrosine aminotransferase